MISERKNMKPDSLEKHMGDTRNPWVAHGINLRQKQAFLRVRRKPIRRMSRWFAIAGVAAFAVQTTLYLDRQGNLAVTQATVEKAASDTHSKSVKQLAAQTTVFLLTTGANTWSVPSDCSLLDTVECIGGGASGGSASGNTAVASGGGAGAYALKSNVAVTPGGSVAYNIAASVAGVAASGTAAVTGNAGGDTWIGNASFASAFCGAKGGSPGTGKTSTTSTGTAAGGAASSSIGDVTYDGGRAGSTTTSLNGTAASGGGGAAGPNGAGKNSATVTGTTTGKGADGDNGFGGAGSAGVGNANSADGGDGTEWDASHGSGGGSGGVINGAGTARSAGDGGNYGAGGGGAAKTSSAAATTSGRGAQGIIVLKYTPSVPAPTVASVSPALGPTGGGTSVTITGTNFSGATSVTFGGASATSVSVVNSTTITCVTPSHAPGVVDVAVTTPGGTGTGSGVFNYIAGAFRAFVFG